MQRRSFLAAVLAAATAPAIARSGILMPVRKVWVPEDDVPLWARDTPQWGFFEPVVFQSGPIAVMAGDIIQWSRVKGQGRWHGSVPVLRADTYTGLICDKATGRPAFLERADGTREPV